VPEKIIHCKVIKLIIIFSSQLRYLFRSCLYTQIFKININLWSSTFQAFFPRRYLSIILLYLYNIMPNITYISCSVWLCCNTIAIHLLKKKNSCDHLSLNTYKSLLRTGSMSRPKNKIYIYIYIYTCINKKYFATNYVSCSIN
jgi:hypothetical protein